MPARRKSAIRPADLEIRIPITDLSNQLVKYPTRPTANLPVSRILNTAAVVIFAYVSVLGTAGCSNQTCPRLGPGEVGFTLIVYGAPIGALAAVAASIVTARRRRGILVPIAAWLLLIAGFVMLAVTFP